MIIMFNKDDIPEQLKTFSVAQGKIVTVHTRKSDVKGKIENTVKSTQLTDIKNLKSRNTSDF